MKNIFLLAIFSTLVILSCSDSSPIDDNSNNNNNNPPPSNDRGPWSIDQGKVYDGGPGKDGIPALVNPNVNLASEDNFLFDDDLVIGLKYSNHVVAFPHKILDYHEIINVDMLTGHSIAVVYCPLTGTGVGWNRNINNTNTTFGVSGLLYKNNLIPYDRATDSYWSQLKLECVNGELFQEIPESTPLPEMTWGVWKKLYPESRVINTNTGHARNYAVGPYGDYSTNNTYFIFPTDALENFIEAKERVHTIIAGGTAKVYRFVSFGNGMVLKDTFEGKDLIIVGNPEFIVSFQLDSSNSDLEFTYSYTDNEIILTDNEGNDWNLFGEALSGPRKGAFLKGADTSMMAYYFSIENFYPDVVIYN